MSGITCNCGVSCELRIPAPPQKDDSQTESDHDFAFKKRRLWRAFRRQQRETEIVMALLLVQYREPWQMLKSPLSVREIVTMDRGIYSALVDRKRVTKRLNFDSLEDKEEDPKSINGQECLETATRVM
jgi:hypothetical protein